MSSAEESLFVAQDAEVNASQGSESLEAAQDAGGAEVVSKEDLDRVRRSRFPKMENRSIDSTHPLWKIYETIPPGDGKDLNDLQLLVLCRVSPKKRYERASKWFARDKHALIYSRYAPTRKTSIDGVAHDRFDRISDETFKKAGISWADMPLFATGGAKKRANKVTKVKKVEKAKMVEKRKLVVKMSEDLVVSSSHEMADIVAEMEEMVKVAKKRVDSLEI